MFSRVQGRRGLDGTPGRAGEPGPQVWTDSRNIYGLLTKLEVKMAGYWPSSIFACSCTKTKKGKKNEKKFPSSDRC